MVEAQAVVVVVVVVVVVRNKCSMCISGISCCILV